MKAISIWQPWASLIAAGAKRWETRSWATRYRGPIAIHAARHWDQECCEVFSRHSVQLELARLVLIDPPLLKTDLPFGAIVAVGVLADCVPTEKLRGYILGDRALGNFAPGRFAWRIDRVERLLQPVDCTGRQGLWEPGTFGNRMASLETVIDDLRKNGCLKKEGWS